MGHLPTPPRIVQSSASIAEAEEATRLAAPVLGAARGDERDDAPPIETITNTMLASPVLGAARGDTRDVETQALTTVEIRQSYPPFWALPGGIRGTLNH